jgi:hypothetical protein
MLVGDQALLAKETARLVHEHKFRVAAQLISDACKLGIKVNSDRPKDYLPPLQTYLHWLLNNGGKAEAAQLLWTPNQFNPNPQSTRDVWNLFETSSTGLIMGAASMSKCLDPSTLCRMFDGSVKQAAGIQVGDLLAAGDGAPRRVLERHDGFDEMVEITPFGAPSFRCTLDHKLTLICTWTKRNHGGNGGVSSGYTPGKIVDVTVAEYLGWGSTRKRAYRLLLRPVFMEAQPTKVVPYVYGAWLGDGTSCRAELTTPKGEMSDEWCRYWKYQGFNIREVADSPKCPLWAVQHPEKGTSIWPTNFFKSSTVFGEKRILREYLHNSEQNRLELLAGLIDSDGHARGGGYDITTKWKGLADDIEYLARSLGFLVTRQTRTHSIKSRGFSAEYHHVYITGDVRKVPCREKKPIRASLRGVTSGCSTTSFEVKRIGRGPYAGFGLDGDHRFLLESGIVTHNSFSMGVGLFLEWIRDPEWTSIRVIGPSEDHLETNLFSHLVNLHGSASLPMPGEVGSLYIGLDRRNLVSAIKGLVIPIGKVKKAGRLQGTKRKPRNALHPIFGELSRLFIFLDEIENVPGGVWSDIDNVLSNLDQVDSVGLKIFGAYNPTNPFDEVGVRAEPVFGWREFDKDKHYRWKSKRGWDVLRLDGEKSENVIAGKIIYPGLQSRTGLERIATNAGGRESPGYNSMGRGAYPDMGVAMTVIPAGMVTAMRGEFIWFDAPKSCASVDMALEGGATASFTLGKLGLASGVKWPPSLEHPNGRTEMFRDSRTQQVTPRWGLQAEQQFPLPKGDTVAMKNAVVDLCRRAAVPPELLCMDRTGNGAGVHDLILNEWSPAVIGVNYSSGPTEKKVMEQDAKVAKEEYDRIDSELWFALRAWSEFKVLLFHPQMDLNKVTPQLTQRLYRMQGGKRKVESKKDFKSRGHESPDEADSLTLFVHAARVGGDIVPSMRGGTKEVGPDSDAWWEGNEGGDEPRIDPSNLSDSLDVEVS